VLSQCANFVVHRIQNPTDIEYFKKILPSGSRDILDQVSILIPGEALLIGSATNVPCRVKVIAPHPEPQSDTSKPSEGWKAGSNAFGWKEALNNLLKDFVEVKK
jgi:DNA helicase HerA-like ATPase